MTVNSTAFESIKAVALVRGEQLTKDATEIVLNTSQSPYAWSKWRLARCERAGSSISPLLIESKGSRQDVVINPSEHIFPDGCSTSSWLRYLGKKPVGHLAQRSALQS